jgi:uncharacterized ferritin-like protein (DUF455 family)
MPDTAPQLNEFARLILFGDRLEDKLCEPTAARLRPDSPDCTEPYRAPAFPGRPSTLLPSPGRIKKVPFPSESELRPGPAGDLARGRVLHFFANHELLAMELMALMLLRFPEAPLAFRQGLARTIVEEQGHLRLYLGRMRELGVEFGELPVSDYFWNAMKDARSPLEFVVQMSLTLEQANLDYSLHYARAND